MAHELAAQWIGVNNFELPGLPSGVDREVIGQLPSDCCVATRKSMACFSLERHDDPGSVGGLGFVNRRSSESGEELTRTVGLLLSQYSWRPRHAKIALAVPNPAQHNESSKIHFQEHRVAKSKQPAKTSGKKSDDMSGLKMVGGAAAGAAAGSLLGPIGAAVGAVVGGIAGANAHEIAESKSVKKLTAATKKSVKKAMGSKSVQKALKKTPMTKPLAKKAPAKSRVAKKAGKPKKSK